MAPHEISNKKKWEDAQRHLKISLQKEIGIMREALANFHEEELSLLERNVSSWLKVMDRRSDLVIQLIAQREKRHKACINIERLAEKQGLKEIFASDDENSVETISLIDQIFALIERLNLQNCRNDALFDQTKQERELPLYCPFPHPLQQNTKSKRKNSIATYQDGE